MAEWISVKDRLPEAFRGVIVCRKAKDGTVSVEAGTMDVCGWWRLYGTRTRSITHWMPFPDPPEDGDA